MKHLLTLVFIFYSIAGLCQSVDWQQCGDWKFYQLTTGKALRYPADSLDAISFVAIDRDSITQYLDKSVLLPVGKSYIWMGSYCVSYSLNNKINKIDVSTHGGFFYDESTKKYYQLPLYMRTEWLDWMSDMKRRVNEKK